MCLNVLPPPASEKVPTILFCNSVAYFFDVASTTEVVFALPSSESSSSLRRQTPCFPVARSPEPATSCSQQDRSTHIAPHAADFWTNSPPSSPTGRRAPQRFPAVRVLCSSAASPDRVSQPPSSYHAFMTRPPTRRPVSSSCFSYSKKSCFPRRPARPSPFGLLRRRWRRDHMWRAEVLHHSRLSLRFGQIRRGSERTSERVSP